MADPLESLSREELIALVRRLMERVAALEAEVARLKKDSSNSSKPPSSDIVKPPKPPAGGPGHKRKIGGQPGHRRHERRPFGSDQIDGIQRHTLDRCPGCGGGLTTLDESAKVVQQVELVDKPVRVTERAYFQFITTPGVEPTNNLAEQAIRFVVLDRKVTQGTRGQAGQRWCERIWTTLATCAQQGQSAFRFLVAAVEAHFHARLAPSLLPAGP